MSNRYTEISDINLRHAPSEVRSAIHHIRSHYRQGSVDEAKMMFSVLAPHADQYAAVADLRDELFGTSTRTMSPMEANRQAPRPAVDHLFGAESPLDIANRTGASYFTNEEDSDGALSPLERGTQQPPRIDPKFVPQDKPAPLVNRDRFREEYAEARLADDVFGSKVSETDSFAQRHAAARSIDSGSPEEVDYGGDAGSYSAPLSIAELAQAASYDKIFGIVSP